MYVVIGTSPFHDTTIGAGPFRSLTRAALASRDLEGKGWNTEVVPLLPVAEIGLVTNDEGADS